MANRLLTSLIFVLLPSLFLAQNPKLLLESGIITPEAQIAWPPSVQEEASQGFYFRLLQFNEIPSTEEKQKLAETGVVLMDYLPHYAYFAAIQSKKQVNWNAFTKIRSVIKVPTAWKMHPDLGDQSELLVSYPAVLEADIVKVNLEALGAEIVNRNDFTRLFSIKIPAEKTQAIAALPYISYIEALPPPPTPERQHFRSGSRSNYLSEVHGFDGSGLVLAVAEGRIDPNLIDLHNRLDISYHTNTTNSNHGTSVSQFMAGAGNLNPVNRGMAYGADVISHSYSIWGNAPTLYANPGLRISNQSWGAGCNTGYNNDARSVDITVNNLPHFMMVFSTGNSQRSNCNYGAGSGWGTITGGVKSGKNVIATGALTRYDEVTGFSSFGPATDGRIKPDLCTIGEGGTSFASPTLAGVYAQLHQAFMSHHAGTEPPVGLIKAILQNTADDIGNRGPDFKHGYGKANARKAYRVISEGTWNEDSVNNAQQRSFQLAIPANTREVKVMIYWSDVAGAANAAKALVNDLDMSMVSPNGNTTLLPWVLDPTADSITLNNDAIRAVDTLNNMEQVTLLNPTAGTWQIHVDGTEVPTGPQHFYVVTQMYQDELVLTYPLGDEGFVPGENEIIRWDATGAGAFDLDYSMDGGASWQQLVTGLSDSLRHYEWTIPDTLQGDVRVRISSGSMNDASDDLTIAPLPDNVSVLWACADSIKLVWDAVSQATAYRITALGARYMDSIETVTNTEVVLRNQSTTDTLWFAVQAIGADNALSRRTIAIRKNPGDFNCILTNAAAESVVSHPGGYLPDCQIGSANPLGVRFRNAGVGPLSNIPVSYRINGGPISTGTISQTIASGDAIDYFFTGGINISSTGTYTIQAWTDLPGDPIANNDTVEVDIVVYASGQSLSLNLVQDFDTFMNCSTAWGCSDIDCPLSAGWFNVPNVLGDSIDFRTNDGGTATGNTGPSNDHTQGNNSGKYIYLETSGNNGSGCQNKVSFLHSPCIDLSNTNQATLSFWRHMFGNSIGELHIDVLSKGQWVEDIIPVVAESQGNMWIKDSADLSAFAGETVVIRFRATTGSGFSGDIALDDILVTTLPFSDFSANRLNICPNDAVQFSDSSFYVDNRQWKFSPNTITFIGGTSSNSQNPEVVFNQSGLYTVTLTNSNSAGSDSLVKTAYINAGPHILSLTTNDADNIVCHGDSLTLTASSVAQTTTFKQAGATLQNGPMSTLSVPNLTTSTSFSAVGTLYPGCLTDEPSLNITVNDPQVAITPADSAQACAGDSILLSADAGFATYTWNNGASNQQVFARTTGHYSVTVADQAACEAQSDSVFIDIIPSPLPPAVNGPATAFLQATDTFQVSGQAGSSFQWGSSGLVNISSNADSAFASWGALGLQTIWVIETSADGCVGDTLFIQVTVTELVGLTNAIDAQSYSVYPNPAEKELFVSFQLRSANLVSLTLFDVHGRAAQNAQGQQAKVRMDIRGLAEGMYLLKIQTEGKIAWEKVWVR